ncbi:hypothetical protein CIK05_04420 [Bdellovibrio sp. qaytius]|nr:hypothetical protein CIK05_04420 [Bdellovibrio sp. qaytius]
MKQHSVSTATSQEHFRALANEAPQLEWITDPQGELVWFNQQWFEYTGLTLDQSVGIGWRQALNPDNLEKTLEGWNVATAAKKTYEVTFQLRSADGIYRWFLSRAVPTFNNAGEVTSWVGTCTDIDNAKLSQHEIVNIIENIDEGFFAIDKDWKITQMNSYHERISQISRHLQIGKSFLDVFFPDDTYKKSIFYESYTKAMNKRVQVKFEGFYEPLKLWASTNIYPKSDGGLAIFYRDITTDKLAQSELIRAKNESERANSLKTTFLANMSHEIRTPLASIMGFAEVLKENTLSEIDKARFLENIIKNGSSLSRIIDDILDLSKVESGHLEVENIEVAFDQLLFEVLSMFRERAKSKNIYLNLNLSSQVPTRIKSDPTRVRQILINLISNAMKFTKDGGIQIDVHSDCISSSFNKFQIQIRDTGIGLTPDQAKRLFRPFTQADNSTTRKYGGTGLGLTLSKRLAQALGGDIRIIKTAQGEGSTFAFEFNAEVTAEENHCEIPDNTIAPSDIDLKNVRVLLAEDSPDSQELIKYVLTNHGATVTVANDGAEALQLARSQDFDVVLMDIQMPELDGYEVTRRLRAENFVKPIIALTAHAMLEERVKTKAAGCDAHITKPLNFRQLVSTVHFINQTAQNIQINKKKGDFASPYLH